MICPGINASLHTELITVNKGGMNTSLVTTTIKYIYGLSRGVATMVYTPQLSPQTLRVDTLVVLSLTLALTSFGLGTRSYLSTLALRTGFNGHHWSFIGTGICLF